MVFDAADKRWCLMPSTTNSSREQLDFFRQSVNPSPGAVLRSLMIDSVRRNQDRLTMSAASQARNQCTWLQWPARAWSDTRLFRDRFQSFCMLQIWRCSKFFLPQLSRPLLHKCSASLAPTGGPVVASAACAVSVQSDRGWLVLRVVTTTKHVVNFLACDKYSDPPLTNTQSHTRPSDHVVSVSLP
jgi:hypothetical protein